ncbi:SusD/RagB family nutrient-binding outer membrane lipoprotein [Tenacibaculum soleae]|uniref:SusD/RagB family nutrient-binding outer membrane lipoprotein n=1 Tax=Tenacibaculum soleae TaxID=447689 RepID=UPI0026E2CEF0|nr:SusD/RagB family nutrient-binding outer membrane lipoprotein [Tenacibaculum soleae]MDO6812672.1 SusD/RagB family nutrient-binding outer membrane lipoprotein [Tenacibaculum soleae]
MKNLKLIFTTLITIIISSCSEFEEINTNPNNVKETHPQLLLTNIEVEAFQVNGTSSLYASRMLVSSDSENNEQYYNWDSASFDKYSALGEITKMIQEATRIKAPEYIALGKFFRAYYFYNLALTFGDIPYSEALQGEFNKVYFPTYSTQKEVFKGILIELAEANNILKTNNNIIDGDIIFKGNTYKWRKLINSFRLKILLSLSKQEETSELNIKSSFANIFANEPIISSSDENAQIVFIDTDGARYTEFNSSGYGSGMYMAKTFVNLLKERNDPRLFIFCTQTKNAKENGLAINDFNAYNGADALKPYGEINTLAAAGELSKVNLRYSTDPTTEAHNILGYWEMEFILAEAAIRRWIITDAKEHYNNGIRASFNFYNKQAKGLENYVNANAANNYIQGIKVNFDSATTVEQQLEFILTQKYFTSFLQTGWRMYFDFLRTGYPKLPFDASATPPTRWMYPNSEYTENSKNTKAAVINQFGEGNDKTRELTWWLK